MQKIYIEMKAKVSLIISTNLSVRVGRSQLSPNADIYTNNTWQSARAVLLIKQQIFYLLFVYVSSDAQRIRWSLQPLSAFNKKLIVFDWSGVDRIGLDWNLSKLRKPDQQLQYITHITNTNILLPPKHSRHKFTCYRNSDLGMRVYFGWLFLIKHWRCMHVWNGLDSVLVIYQLLYTQ